MDKRNVSSWNVSKGIARGLLRDRQERRRLLARILMVVLALISVGLWLIDHWLAANVWRFLLWWGACAALTCLMMMLALYDLLAVIREERENAGR
jgi:hypothetical protein